MDSCIDNKVEPKFRHTGLKVSEKKDVPELQFGTCECLCVYHTGNRANRIDDKFCNFSHAFCLNFEYHIVISKQDLGIRNKGKGRGLLENRILSAWLHIKEHISG